MFYSWPDLYGPKLLGFDFDRDFLQPEFDPLQTIKSEPQSEYRSTNIHTQPLGSPFSSQGLPDPSHFDVFLEPLDVSQLENEVQFPFGRQFFEPMGCCPSHDVGREKVDNPESFFSEFPADIFDHIEPLGSSPENWFFFPFISVKCWKLWSASVSVNFTSYVMFAWSIGVSYWTFSFSHLNLWSEKYSDFDPQLKLLYSWLLVAKFLN